MAETLLLALLIFLTVRAVVQNFKVEGSSMEPTLHHGQYLLVNKAAYLGIDLAPLTGVLPVLAQSEAMVAHPFGTPNRGDIVVFRFPRNPDRDFIKRVVALPGETVEVRAGVVYINNQRFEEAYVLENPTYSREPAVVPPDNYFVLGDNRNNSSDSHVWGPVPMENIVGKAWLTYWPWKDSGFIPGPQAAAQR
ncbi:MAG: signal peptidase I [Chloroflexi bacterium]|nr:signal peptidase I [Chloroflexota bacterium]